MRKQQKKMLYAFTLWFAALCRKNLGFLPESISLPTQCKEHHCSTAALHSTTSFSQATETKPLLQFEHKEGRNKNGREPREMNLFDVNYSIKIIAYNIPYRFSGISCKLLM